MAANEIRSSFGVEVEFLVGMRFAGQHSGTPRRFWGASGRPITAPVALQHDPFNSSLFARDRISEVINAAIQDHEGDRVVASEHEASHNPESLHLKSYLQWHVKEDVSVYLPPEIQEETDMNNYLWENIEITSPALWATENSYAEVQHIIQTLSDTFWVVTPHTAGLHVHYGRGTDWIPFRDLRRIAAFLYAADPIIAQMHPKHRRETAYAPSNRLYSNLAHWMTTNQASDQANAHTLEAGPELTDDSVSGREPEPRPTRARGPNFKSIFKRGMLEGYTFQPDLFNYTRIDGLDENVNTPLSIPTAAQFLFASLNAPTVSMLMAYDFYRAAYNFKPYAARTYRQYRRARDGGVLRQRQEKRTVEFRQPASTFVPEEITTHCKIIVQMCEWASTVELNELWKLILDLSQVETNGEWYDVFDLLTDLGLNDEARVVQRQMANERGIKILNEERGRARWPHPPGQESRARQLFTTVVTNIVRACTFQ
ncbi:hypothetical protein AAE478_010095 [Parahypoxylon ruwenzoriense]